MPGCGSRPLRASNIVRDPDGNRQVHPPAVCAARYSSRARHFGRLDNSVRGPLSAVGTSFGSPASRVGHEARNAWIPGWHPLWPAVRPGQKRGSPNPCLARFQSILYRSRTWLATTRYRGHYIASAAKNDDESGAVGRAWSESCRRIATASHHPSAVDRMILRFPENSWFVGYRVDLLGDAAGRDVIDNVVWGEPGGCQIAPARSDYRPIDERLLPSSSRSSAGRYSARAVRIRLDRPRAASVGGFLKISKRLGF